MILNLVQKEYSKRYNRDMKFIQLNTITEYSFSKSIIQPESYAKKAKELGYSAIGFADDNIHSFAVFAKACLKEGLKPIFGYRIFLSSSQTHPLDAVLYILNEEGYLNLCKLLESKKNLYGLEDFKDCHRGLCIVVDTENQDYFEPIFQDLVAPLLFKYHQIFQDDFYYGITLNTSEDKEEVSKLYEFANTTSTKTLAFPRVCYLRKQDAYTMNLAKAGFEKQTLTNIVEKEGPNFLLSTKALISVYREEDLLNLEYLTDSITFELFQKRGKLIHFDDDDQVLKEMAMKGLCHRLNTSNPDKVYLDRLNYELSVISQMHFSSYFILVQDYCNYAKNNDIKVGPGRGSAGGSLVAYSLSITELDPIRYRLSFERFLNPKRETMPDIDIDFEDTKRSLVIDYLKRKYGEDRVCEIITYSTLKPRAALNFVGPCLSFNPSRLKRLTSSIATNCSTFQDAINDRFYGYRFKKMMEDSYYRDLVMKATPLLSLPVNTSIHASGILVNNDPIYKTSPMSEGRKGTSCFEYPYMEEMGYLKVDILGLSNLTFIRSIEERILKNQKSIPNIQDVLDDELTFRVLNHLDVCYIFQLESQGMKDTISLVKPSTFSDIASLIALYRPGPKEYIPLFAKRKHQNTPIEYPVESLRPVLEETYGIMVYQEEVMETLKVVASFSASDADLFRRAISKKKKALMDTYKEKFLVGCKGNGIDESTAKSIYADIEKFSSYGFNKSHAYSYALIVYQLLYYKAHFALEFYQASLAITSLTSDKFISLGMELKGRGQKIRSVSINHSLLEEASFQSGDIYLPLRDISGIQMEEANLFVQEREKRGPYISFFDFIRRNIETLKKYDPKYVIPFIESGAFDELYIGRKAMKESLSTAISFLSNGFDESSIPPLELKDEDLGERLSQELYSLGIILSIRFQKLFYKEGYKTLLVKDDSQLEMNHLLICTSENKEYPILVPSGKSYTKNEFLFVQADFKKKGRIEPTSIIEIGNRKVSDYVKNLHR